MKSNLFKFIHSLGIGHLLRISKKNQLTILSLHRISNEEDYFFNPILPQSFEKLLIYIKKHYTVISFQDLREMKMDKSKPLLILSFDDGYYDFYEYALPILNKYRLLCNHNIVNDCANDNTVIWTQRLNFIFNHCRNNKIELQFDLNQQMFSLKEFDSNWMKFYIQFFQFLLTIPKLDRLKIIDERERELAIEPKVRMMNWDEIRDCSRMNVEIGCHTYSHDVLSTVVDEGILIQEIINSKIEIEQKIDKNVSIIALPNGQGNDLIDNFCLKSGFEFLLYVNDGVNDLDFVSNSTLNKFDRISLIEESYPEMVLRTELLHSKLRKYV